jgi:hypothetical protein
VAVPPPGVLPGQSSASPPGSTEAPAPLAPNEALLRSAREVPEGRITGRSVWFAQFRMLRREGDLGKTFVEAQSRCAETGMSLCSEVQWTRACEVHPGLGSTASWTASAEASGFVVRGGFGCADRAIAKGGEVNAERGGMCCDRAVGIDTKNTNRSFLRATSDRLLEIERTLNQRNPDAFLAFVADPVTIDGAPRPRAEAHKLLTDSFSSWPDHWIINDECAVTIAAPVVVVKRTRRRRVTKHVESPSWSADCEQTRHRAGEIAVVTTSYVFTGAGKLRSIADSRVVRDWAKP